MPVWLPGEVAGQRARELLGEARVVAASDLAILECERVLILRAALGDVEKTASAMPASSSVSGSSHPDRRPPRQHWLRPAA